MASGTGFSVHKRGSAVGLEYTGQQAPGIRLLRPRPQTCAPGTEFFCVYSGDPNPGLHDCGTSASLSLPNLLFFLLLEPNSGPQLYSASALHGPALLSIWPQGYKMGERPQALNSA